MPTLPKVYAAVKTIGAFTIARKRTDGLFYIFDNDGGINKDDAFTTVERAEAYLPTMDHTTKFTATIAGSRYVPSWRK